MKKKPVLTFILLVLAQVFICNFCNFTQFMMITILPMAILFLPVTQKPYVTMVIAFIAGFAVDFLADGMLGITSLSLVPVAFTRRFLVRLIFGSEVIVRQEDISMHKHGIADVLIIMLTANLIFLTFYIWTDSAGMRPTWFNILKDGISLVASTLVSMLLFPVLTSDGR